MTEPITEAQIPEPKPLLSAIDSATRARLLGSAARRTCEPNEIVFLQAEPCAGLFIVVGGLLKIAKVSPEGREQVLRHCRQEIPYSAAVVVDVFDESERAPDPERPARASPGRPALAGLVRIGATVFVERESQKAIVIGKKGAMLKKIGTDARKAVERLLGTHVFLSIVVKVEPRWSERADALRKLGYQ